MSDEREYTQPVVVEREINTPEVAESIDTAPESGVEVKSINDPRMDIADKYAAKQRDGLGIVELEPTRIAPSEEMVSVKVNGRERQVAKSKIEDAGGLDVYQKRLAAEERLQEASQQRKLLEQQQSELQAKVTEFQRWQQQQIARLAEERNALASAGRPSPSPSQSQEAKELAKRYHAALIDGEDDLASDLLLQLQQRATAQQPAINAQEIENRAVQRVRQEQQKQAWDNEHAVALNEFREQYADVMANPRLTEVADQYTIHLQKTTQLTPRAILRAAGDYARQFRDEIAGRTEQGGNGGAAQNRTEAKRAMSVRPASGRSPAPSRPSFDSPSSYIEKLKASRGQL